MSGEQINRCWIKSVYFICYRHCENKAHIQYYSYFVKQILLVRRNASVIFFYNIPRNITMGYEKWYASLFLSRCERIQEFGVQIHVNSMEILRFWCCVDLVYFVLVCMSEILLGEVLLFQINIPLLKHLVDKNM